MYQIRSKCVLIKNFTSNLNRCKSHVAIQDKTVKFTDTINLPKTNFPARLNPNQKKDVERFIREVRPVLFIVIFILNFLLNFQKHLSSLYSWQESSLKSPTYILHDGPPYGKFYTSNL
jgi:hypothetical protein